jgi:predicted PolB exonuclease-like 3'-5' exonuclease
MPELRYLVFDIETVPDPSLHQPDPAIPGDQRPMAPLPTQRLVSLGAMGLDARFGFLWLDTIGDDERSAIESFVQLVASARPRLVSFNGRGFDLPVLLLRSLHHGLSIPWFFDSRAYRDRHGGSHLDLQESFGWLRHLSLRAACKLIGLPGKLDVDGSQVEPLFLAGQQQTIDDYCLCDVVQTAFLMLRLQRLRGTLSASSYRSAAGALLDGVSQDRRLEELLVATDKERLLLAPST